MTQGLSRYGIAAIHTKPDDAVKEIDSLYNAYRKFVYSKRITRKFIF